MKYNKKGFSLVELVIVIVILSILGTIAFMSLQGYSEQARDSTRISDISSIRTSLELFQLDNGKYPKPTNSVNITYSGGIVWNQGIFGENVKVNVDKLDKVPLDPSTNKEYTYSTTDNKNEYQIGGIMETDTISLNDALNISNAAETTAVAYVAGTYNGLMTKTNSGVTCTILSVPTIITNDTSVTNLEQIVSNNSFVYRGFKNLPASFKNSKFKYDGGFDYVPSNIVAYTDTGSCAELTDTNSNSARIALVQGLQNSYSGTILQNEGEIKNITSLNINQSNPSKEVINAANNLVNKNFATSLPISSNTSTGVNVYDLNNVSSLKYRMNFNNSHQYTVNTYNTMTKNGLKLYQFPVSNICYTKSVVCSSGLTQTECNRSCDQADSSTYEVTTGTNWMRYDLGFKYIVNQLLTLSYETSGLETIKDYELYGSNDDSSYSLVTTGTHPNAGGYQTKNFTNNTAYRYYKFQVLSHYPGNGGNNRYLRDLKLMNVASYLSEAYYTTTSSVGATLNLSSLGITKIGKITVSDTKPTNTNVKYLLSFDGKSTWYYFNGSSWVQASGGLNDISTVGMTSEYLNSLTESNLTYLGTQSSIDVAAGLKTDDVLVTPTVNYIDFNYDSTTITGIYENCKDIKTALPDSANGIYYIHPGYKYRKQVYCDMTTDGGGWTMISNIIGGAVSTSDITYTLTGSFVSPNSIIADLTNNSTETRYNCKRLTNILDLKTTYSEVRDRQYSTGLRCTNGYWYTFANAATYFTGIGSNNYTPVTNTWHGSCLDATVNLNVSPIGLNYLDWFMRDQTSNTMSCAGSSTSTEYMRVFIR